MSFDYRVVYNDNYNDKIIFISLVDPKIPK